MSYYENINAIRLLYKNYSETIELCLFKKICLNLNPWVR